MRAIMHHPDAWTVLRKVCMALWLNDCGCFSLLQLLVWIEWRYLKITAAKLLVWDRDHRMMRSITGCVSVQSLLHIYVDLARLRGAVALA
jgi:hypothetical protein